MYSSCKTSLHSHFRRDFHWTSLPHLPLLPTTSVTRLVKPPGFDVFLPRKVSTVRTRHPVSEGPPLLPPTSPPHLRVEVPVSVVLNSSSLVCHEGHRTGGQELRGLGEKGHGRRSSGTSPVFGVYLHRRVGEEVPTFRLLYVADIFCEPYDR